MSLSDVDSIAASIRREEHAVQRGAQLRAAYDRRFCRHGTYVGNPYGADYLCGACEDGED